MMRDNKTENGIFGLCFLASAVLALALISGTAQAQTKLHLSATGSIVTAPDEMVATFSVQANAAKAAAAQAAVNMMMGKALATASRLSGVVASTGAYNVYETSGTSGAVTGYQASQSLNLTAPAPGGKPSAAFTDLVGDLQADGLLLNSLQGDLSPQGQRQAKDAAVTEAIHRLKSQVRSIAATLGETPGTIDTLTVNTGAPPSPMPMRMMMAAAAPPPQAAPGPITVQADVSAVIELIAPPK